MTSAVRMRSAINPPMRKEDFDRAISFTAMHERTRRAAELFLVHGYSLNYIARSLGIRHRQQVHDAAKRVKRKLEQIRAGSAAT